MGSIQRVTLFKSLDSSNLKIVRKCLTKRKMPQNQKMMGHINPLLQMNPKIQSSRLDVLSHSARSIRMKIPHQRRLIRKKRKDPPSPKSNVSVKEMKAKIDLQEKYRLQRNLKDVSKEKGKFKRTCKKSPVETVEDPVAKMMKKIMSELQEIKSDVKGTNN